MSDTYTSGTWVPYPGKEQTFVEAWAQFAQWASGQPGAGALTLAQDVYNPERYLSFGDWETGEAARDWKASPEFQERIAHVLEHVAEFNSSELTLVATASNSSVEVLGGQPAG